MKVLIVDDDYVLLWMIRESVNWEKLGIHQIFTAGSAEKAREIIAAEDVDIIISDIEMPRESGLDLLRWYRAEQYTGKFLLLTAHEKFSYAADAIRYHADEYLTKPFNVEIMELVLQKIGRELILEKRERDAKQWMAQNARKLRSDLLEGMLTGRLYLNREERIDSIRNLQIQLDAEGTYRMVVSRVVRSEVDHSDFDEEFLEFLLEQIHQDMEEPGSGETVLIREEDGIHIVSLHGDAGEKKTLEAARGLLRRVDSLADLTLTMCISDAFAPEQMSEVYRRLCGLLRTQVHFLGTCFYERDAGDVMGRGPILDMKKMDMLMEQKDRKGILDYVKQEMDARTRSRTLDRAALEILQAEIRQSVYVYLSGKGIQISAVIDSDNYQIMARNAAASVIGFIKWINYLLDRTFAVEREYNPSEEITDKINRFIEEHYMEDIGRNEIGAHFFLVPEYVSRMYKKRTGVNLKDRINEYRIGRAKVLLLDPTRNISDIASDVGFGNLSYFSTVFKKSVGLTPNEYRRTNARF